MIGYSGIYHRDKSWSPSDDDHLTEMINQLQGTSALEPLITEFESHGRCAMKIASIDPRSPMIAKENEVRKLCLFGELYPQSTANSLLEAVLADDSENLTSSIQDLNGAFNLIVYDKTNSQVKIFRDIGGVKACFYHDNGQEVIFSSGLRSVAKSSLYRDKQVDTKGLWLNLAYPAPPQPLTAFKDISCLERGSRLSINSTVTTDHYWTIPSRDIDIGMDFNYAVERVHSTLTDATSDRVQGIQNLGSTLSGGVDSAYLSALAFQNNEHTEAYTFKLAGEEYSQLNEDDVAALTARKYGMKHHIKSFVYDDFMEDFQTLIKLYEQPGISIGAYYSIAKLGHQLGYSHVVNGLAGDELFGGFHFFKHLSYWPLLRLLSPVASLVPSNRTKGIDKFIKVAGAGSIDEYYSRAFAIYLDKELKNVFNNLYFSALDAQQELYNPRREPFKDSISGLMHYMFSNCPNHHIYRFESFSNHFGIQPLYPFLDNNVIEHAFKVPSRFKVKGHKRKIVLKQAAAPYVVQPALTENKRGVGAPVNSWMNTHLKDIKEDKLNRLKQREIFNAQYIDQIIKEYPQGYGKKLWKLVMTELWMEEFID